MDDVAEAVAAGAEALFVTQRPDGVFDHGTSGWTSTLATVGAITALHYADRDGSADVIAAGVDWLCRVQDAEGGWSTVPGWPSEPGPTAITAASLQLLAPERGQVIDAGLKWVEGAGGIEALPHEQLIGLCRQFYALAGWLDERDLRRLPLELTLFPRLFLRMLDFRAPLLAAFGLAQQRGRLLGGPARRAALAHLRQIFEHEGRTGEFGNDPWPAGMICGALARADVAPEIVGTSAAWLRSRANPDGSWPMMALDLTWSTNAAAGLIEAGHGDDPRLATTVEMFRRRHQDRPFKAFDCPPGFWGWCGSRGWPDAWVTADVVSALAVLGPDDVMWQGVDWLTAQQDDPGSWGFCVRNSKATNSGPCPVTTAAAVNALLAAGIPVSDPRIRRAVFWLLAEQREDGSFDSQWYRTYTAGTAIALELLARVISRRSRAVRRARAWLLRTQLGDGSWATGHPNPGHKPEPGTVEETAWAVRALLASGMGSGDEPVSRGAAWLMRAQNPDGQWPAAPVNDYIRRGARFPNTALAGGLAIAALSRFKGAE
ncbi:prenyltransferase/squalene oxidase repeat-containing protein [Spirillospora sp. CA-294931]|uniref:prenyltransferase/squalene oxidase repeat-containing protein n=1 Tax=Spirillospora sp. CA-294931 TaxID=3240042 RepID=UPI003D914CE2